MPSSSRFSIGFPSWPLLQPRFRAGLRPRFRSPRSSPWAPALVLLLGSLCAASGEAQRAGATPLRPHGAAALARSISALLAQPSEVHAHWGISVVTLDGSPIYSLHDAELFHPASSTKLFTTATAFALLPSGLTFTTQIVSTAPPDASGTIHGDLVLLGAGDPEISGRTIPYDGRTERPGPPLAALEQMANQLASRGIHSITGSIIGDDTWFVWERYGAGWSWDDLEWGYGASVSALTVNDNVVYLNVLPGSEPGATTIASWLPATSYYALQNSLLTGGAGSIPQPGIDRQPGSFTVRLYGQIPLAGEGVHVALAIEDPAQYAAKSLQEMLAARGISVSGTAQARHRLSLDTGEFLREQEQPAQLHPVSLLTVAPPTTGSTVLAAHVSPPLGDDLVVTNKVSQNLHAELLLRTLGKLEGSDGTVSEGARVVRQFLIGAGANADEFLFFDGSGLSTENLVTPRTFTTLLCYAARQSWGEAFRASLPVGGVDGTLKARFKQPLLNGKVFAKTGTLGEDTALTGYLTAASGRTVAFSILSSDHHPGGEGVPQMIDKIVALIARAN